MAKGSTSGKNVALLRGINVGGKNSLPMKDLAAIFKKAGCTDVKTFIQSGNVVFAAPEKTLKTISAAVTASVEKRLGFKIPVVVRTVDEVGEIVRKNAFPKCDPDADRLHVFFLASMPDAAGLAALDPGRSPGDSFKVVGREIYALFPNGAGNSKLTNAYFDAKLKTVSTARNWRTVLKLMELMKT
jgi:uncharacterized protein (DUF1697 family)